MFIISGLHRYFKMQFSIIFLLEKIKKEKYIEGQLRTENQTTLQNIQSKLSDTLLQMRLSVQCANKKLCLRLY